MIRGPSRHGLLGRSHKSSERVTVATMTTALFLLFTATDILRHWINIKPRNLSSRLHTVASMPPSPRSPHPPEASHQNNQNAWFSRFSDAQAINAGRDELHIHPSTRIGSAQFANGDFCHVCSLAWSPVTLQEFIFCEGDRSGAGTLFDGMISGATQVTRSLHAYVAALLPHVTY